MSIGRHCYFNNKNLNLDNTFEVTSVDALGQPEVRVNSYQLARSDGEKVTAQFYGGREIKVKGRIVATSRVDMEQKLDTLKTYLVGTEKDFDIEVAGATRRYTATNTNFNNSINGYYCEWEADFTADALAKDLISTSLTYGTYTTSPTSYNFTIAGSYKTKPYIDFTVNQVNPYWQAKYLQIQNASENQRIRFTREWGWFDRVVVDGFNRTVSLYPTTKTEIDDCDDATDWTSTHTLSLEETNMIEGIGALKVVMAGAAVTTDFIRLDSTSIELSSTTGTVIVPVFIPTPTAGAVASVSLYIGKNATLAADYDYWTLTTQWDGSAITENAWNYFTFDMSTAVTGTNGTPDRTAILSLQVVITGTSAAMQLNGAYLDYITLQKASVTSEVLDYEGTFPDLTLGSTTLTFSDELTSRDITVTGNYIKRYL